MLIVLILIELLIIASLVLYIVLNKRKMKVFSAQAELIKKRKLDLDDIEVGERRNDMVYLAEAINAIKNNMLTFLESTKSNVVVLSDAIDVLSDSASLNQDGSKQITDSLHIVVGKVEEQLNLVKNCLELVEDNTNRLYDIDASMKEIDGLLDDTVKSCTSGMTNLDQYEKNMITVSEDLANSEQILLEFTKKIEEINEIGDFIVNISESLKMLALNASIEAARVGSAGSGFAVVAKEMGVMSEKTQEGIGMIYSILESVTQSSSQVSKSIRGSVEMFDNSSKEFNEVSASFRTIDKQSGEINAKMQTIFSRIKDITDNSNTTKERAKKTYFTSEEITAGIQEISQVSVETADASTKILDNVGNLDSMLGGLEQLIKQFTTSIEPVKTKPKKKIKIGIICICDNEFWRSVRRGSIYAKKELENLGAEVRYISFDNWAVFVGLLHDSMEQMLADDFDGYLFPGFIAHACKDVLAELRQKGKKVFCFNCDIEDGADSRDAVFQPDLFESGTIAGKCMEKALPDGGQVIMLRGDEKMPVNIIRCEAFEKYLSKNSKFKVERYDFAYEEEEVYQLAKECIKNNPNLKGMYIPNGTTLAVARAIEESGRNIKLVMFDHSQKIFEYIKKGIIVAAIGQDPFGQGHDPIIWMYNTIVTGQPMPAEIMKCRSNVVDQNNVDSLIEV